MDYYYFTEMPYPHLPPHEGAPSLDLIGFSKRFGALAALDNVSIAG